MNLELIQEAKKDFDEMIKNATKPLIAYKPGFGLTAMTFARRYTDTTKDRDTYHEIYDIYYNFFNNL